MRNIEKLAEELDAASSAKIVKRALTEFGGDIAISFSGAEDVLLIEYAKQSGCSFRVFSLDTGRLHPETYRFFQRVEAHYGIHIEYCFPEHSQVEKLVREKGYFSFFEDGHQECCNIRKVAPLRRQLSGLSAWITGQRKDQNPSSRGTIPVVQTDGSFKGKDGGPLVKWNPLANMTSTYVWDSIRAFEVPYNALHEKGYISIGCEPCTRPVLPGQHERDGRWWWERDGSKECGLHVVR